MLLTQPNKFTLANRTIKNNHLFLVDTMLGEIPEGNDSGLGLYHLDTRFLSCLEFRLNDTEPVCLFSSTESGYLSTLVYTNGQMASVNTLGQDCVVREECIELSRETVLDGAMLEKITLTNYNIEPVELSLTMHFDADFRDIFEIRHLVPPKNRELPPPEVSGNMIRFTYQSPCTTYETRIIFEDVMPDLLDDKTVRYKVFLRPLEKATFHIRIQTVLGNFVPRKGAATRFDEAVERIKLEHEVIRENTSSFVSDNSDFNDMIERSQRDLQMLLTEAEDNTPFIAAGIPWYVCLFGRDSIITSRECLMFNPEIAKWTLEILAKYQGTKVDPWRDEEPGKILHELRVGELACLGEIPHTPYYGSVDATPLWLILLYDYYQWTRDTETLCKLWSNALAALNWIDTNMDKDPRKYATYKTGCSLGIIHQGWKDSSDSAMYENGIQAEPPIALVEVQGYIYLAKKRMATLAEVVGDKNLRQTLRHDCLDLKYRFNRDFWMDDMRFYAMGLDNQGTPLRVVSSNVGHCLETGIFTTPRARQVASRLMMPDMFNGWGIRTLSAEMMAYNPMSYHNGSIWPHDNAMIAKGLSAIGRPELAGRVFSGMFEAARLMFYKRLPELFCGFVRDYNRADPPVKYPVACSPQAWAAASFYSLLQSMLSITPDLTNNSLKIVRPRLPEGINSLQVHNLRVGSAILDLDFRKTEKTVMVDVHNRRGKLDVLVKL